MDSMMYKELEKQEILNKERMCENGQEVEKEPVSKTILRILSNLESTSLGLNELVSSRLDPILPLNEPDTFEGLKTSAGCTPPTPPPQYPPLFAEMMIYIDGITRNLREIRSTIYKVEV